MSGVPGDEEAPRGIGALADLKVVELGVWVAAPATAALLADWGAQVVKVEPPTGDPMRNVFGALGIGLRRGVPCAQAERPFPGRHAGQGEPVDARPRAGIAAIAGIIAGDQVLRVGLPRDHAVSRVRSLQPFAGIDAVADAVVVDEIANQHRRWRRDLARRMRCTAGEGNQCGDQQGVGKAHRRGIDPAKQCGH